MDELRIAVMTDLPCDGERFIPGSMHGLIVLEHWHRYLFASQFAIGKDVLDIASGEGYGSAHLARVARSVVGVDISPDAIRHASRTYRRTNLNYVAGNCQSIPLTQHSVDVVVSFETIEHIENHRAMLSEIKRVLRPGGLLIMSSPDKEEYSDVPGFANSFHVSELYAEEFRALLAEYFINVETVGQRVLSGSVIAGRGSTERLAFANLDDLDVSHNVLPKPIYLIGIATENDLPDFETSILERDCITFCKDLEGGRNPDVCKIIHDFAGRDSPALKRALGSDWFRQQNPDLPDGQSATVAHWFASGWAEGRLPSADIGALLNELVAERCNIATCGAMASVATPCNSNQVTHIGQQQLEGALARARLAARYEADGLLRRLADRERSFAEQVLLFNEAIDNARAEHQTREEAQGREIRRLQAELAEAQRLELERRELHESAIAGLQQATHMEINDLRRGLAERERQHAEQLAEVAATARAERAEADALGRAMLAEQRSESLEREETLRREVEKAGDLLREAQLQMQEQHHTSADALAQLRESWRAETEGLLRELTELERTSGEQLASIAEVSLNERAELRVSSRATLEAQRADLGARIEALQQEIRRLTDHLSEAHRCAHEQERLHAELVTQLQESERATAANLLREMAERERAFHEALSNQQHESQQHQHRLLELAVLHLNIANQSISQMKQAWSWRLTAPFRSIGSYIGLSPPKTEFHSTDFITSLFQSNTYDPSYAHSKDQCEQ